MRVCSPNCSPKETGRSLPSGLICKPKPAGAFPRVNGRKPRAESREFIEALKAAAKTGNLDDIGAPAWEAVRDLLAELSANRAKGGYTPTETASFVFSLKEPVFMALQAEIGKDPAALSRAIWQVTLLIDKLGLLPEAFRRPGKTSFCVSSRN